MGQNFVAQFIQLNWALSVDQWWLQVSQFSKHLIDLLSIFLRYNDFIRIQKAVVDQMGSRPPNSDHDLFWGASLAMGSALKLLLSPSTEMLMRHPLTSFFTFPVCFRC
ncbi:hypothetical protein FD755_022377 [Muntiacus reevesi]|uniref:Uncharacterized protein n=1 Tax=Muntiacus reevesi TaxID=9886 RepID=A0A5N3W020_MUNRE|nr:hypothetical protein FD755_022377 [Muntiacus reevesi]